MSFLVTAVLNAQPVS